MKSSVPLLLLLIIQYIQSSVSATDLEVTIVEGPKGCSKEDEVLKGKEISVNFNATIDESSETGEKGLFIDSTYRGSGLFNFTIGVGEVMPGWDEGMLYLCEGAKAILVIPPELAYKDVGDGYSIPPGATLRFEIGELFMKSEDDFIFMYKFQLQFCENFVLHSTQN